LGAYILKKKNLLFQNCDILIFKCTQHSNQKIQTDEKKKKTISPKLCLWLLPPHCPHFPAEQGNGFKTI